MKNKVKIIIILTAVLLTGCSKENNKADESVQITENIQEENNGGMDTEHITRQMSDNLSVDADIFYPPDTSIAVYEVDRTVFVKDAVRLFLSEDKMQYEIEDNPNYENTFTVDTDGGSSLYVSEGYFTYVKDNKRDGDVVAMIEGYLLQEDNIQQEKELTFLKKEDAVAMGKEKIKELSGNQAEAVRVVAMSHEDLAQLQNNLLKEESYQSGINNGTTNRIDEFAGEDDVYYIEYAIVQDELFLYEGILEPPISMALDVFWDFPVNVIMLAGKDGIRYFDYRNSFSDSMIEKEKVKIISVDEVLKIIEEKYNSIILEQPVTVSKIWLEYVPVPDWEDMTQIELRPYWCVQIDSVDEEGIYSSAERINAATGGSLAYGK